MPRHGHSPAAAQTNAQGSDRTVVAVAGPAAARLCVMSGPATPRARTMPVLDQHGAVVPQRPEPSNWMVPFLVVCEEPLFPYDFGPGMVFQGY